MADRKKAIVSVRSDAQTKNGGDYQMMRAFAQQLGADFETEIAYGVPSPEQLDGADFVLCTNLDRPIEAQSTLWACRQRNVAFALYTLHHPHAGIEAYLRHGTRGFKRRIAQAVGFDPQMYEQALWALRGADALLRKGRGLRQGSVHEAQLELLQNSDALVCCAALEAAMIGVDIRPIERVFIVPHPADAPAVDNASPVTGRVVVAGRIEARKNQISALKMAEAQPDLEFCFVGAPVASEKRYFDEFSAQLKSVPNARYLPALPKEEFYPFLANAELVLNPSFFEVTSLIDVFCVANNIPLVTTKHTYLRGTGCFRSFESSSVSDGVAAITECVNEIRAGGRKVTLIPEDEAISINQVARKLL